MLNIYKLMLDKGISIATVARKSGFKYYILRDRLIGKTPFKTFEAMQVYKSNFVEYDYAWLFQETK